jgi:hypothetical protein
LRLSVMICKKQARSCWTTTTSCAGEGLLACCTIPPANDNRYNRACTLRTGTGSDGRGRHCECAHEWFHLPASGRQAIYRRFEVVNGATTRRHHHTTIKMERTCIGAHKERIMGMDVSGIWSLFGHGQSRFDGARLGYC